MSKFALQLGDPEYFLLGILGLVAIASIGSGDKIKNLTSIVLGLIAGTVGVDIFTGSQRFTGNIHELSEGINLIAIVVALFAFTEVFYMISGNLNHRNKIDASNLKTKLTFQEFKSILKPTGIGSIVGSFVGILPGVGSSASGWFGYIAAKKVSKDPKSFGTGNPEGIAAPESANNATVGGALLPLLTLGIPGSASLAIIAGAFIIHGIQPGPQIFSKTPELVNGIFVGFIITAILMYFMGRLLTTGFARILVTPNAFLVPGIVIFSVIGIYASSSSHFNLWFALVLGIIAFYCRLLNYSIYSFVLAFVLSPIIEVSLRRALVISDGSYMVFFTRTYSIILILLMLIFVIFGIIKWMKSRNMKEEENISA
ncbi:tripartite tricarboxylate transporter permease [Halalkalibacter krulwichiae]|uniref:Tripartite tricarboxylate transporter TctA family protein n=1 Tax=Halalkalibacter krulwichiae TaxID=199441 RepID=A0A1X9MGL4_9BACI|nr:tripartite tricarboxylate transporter permease [Halalkalibacter krulwichiae]ARK32597.1 Tripartite tricarboxylate transporter TctA family protein [Halalkalibacter krulwichiae]